MRRKISILISFIAIFTLLLSGCGNQQNKSNAQSGNDGNENAVYSGQEGRITVYVSGPEKMIGELENKFEENIGDVLNVFRTGCGPLRQKVWTEMEAGSIQADVVWGAEPLMYIALQGKGKLLQYKSPEAEALLPEYVMGDGYYTLVNARYGVILYNKDRVTAAEVPSAWADLTDAKWKGRLAMADATQSAMALALSAGLYQIHNDTWDYHKALKKNEIMLTKQNVEVASKVEAGEVDAGIAPHDEALRLIKQSKMKNINSPLTIAWPAEGAISCQRPVAIIKNDARPDVNDRLAKDFVDFILSPAGQQLAAKYGFITVRNDQELPPGVPEAVESVALDWSYASEHEDELRKGFEDIMLN